MSFGEAQLRKFGWEKGKGLGREENGISEPIKARLKRNLSGLGHNQAKDFEFQWWDHVYNKIAKNISVKKNKKGDVELENEKEVNISTKRSISRTHQKDSHYGFFVKTTVLNGASEVSVAPPKTDEDKLERSEELIKTLTDDQLFKSCGGLTAHKGARHGITMSAKLARLEKQEQHFLSGGNNNNKNNNNNSSSNINNSNESSNKKRKSEKIGSLGENLLNNCKEDRDYTLDNQSEHLIKKKKRKRDESRLKEMDDLESNNSIELEEMNDLSKPKKKKKKKKKKEKNDS